MILIEEVNKYLTENKYATTTSLAIRANVFPSTIEKVLLGKAVTKESEKRIRKAIQATQTENKEEDTHGRQ